MDMPKYTCNYTGGMNKDISPNNYPNTCYFDATNFRIITSDSAGLSDSSLSTVKGNAVSFTIPDSGKLLGYSVLRDYLIILVNAVGQTNPDRIYRIPLSSLQTAQDLILNNTYYWNSGYLVYWNDLSFNVANPIKVVANYENDEIQKIYWVDDLNSLRHLNIVYNSIYNDLSTLDPELLEISPNHTYGSYTLTEQSGGHLKAGRIQYSYQLYSISGTETMFAPPSNLYNITTYTPIDGVDFVGNDLETEVNKSLTINITLQDGTSATFNRIRLLALEYEIYNDVPKIRVVSEQELNTDSVIFYDYGDSIGELTIEEFQIIKNDLIPTTIESLKNYLFAGNVIEEFFDIDGTIEDLSNQARDFFDTRAYRWRYIKGVGSVVAGTQNLTRTTDPHSVADIPGYGTGSYDTIPVLISLLNDASWAIDVRIGAPEHAAAQSPVRTVTGVSAITSSEIRIDFYTSSWVNSLRMVNPTGFTYTPEDANHGILHIWGTQYAGTKPSGLSPAYPSGGYTKSAITALSYDYTYTYVTASATSVDSVLNKGLDGEFVVDDGSILNYNVPETHDAINTYNSIINDEDLNRSYEYKYKKITSAAPPTIADLGGTGRYISYGFIYHDEVAGTVELIGEGADLHPVVHSLTSTDVGYKDPNIIYNYTSHQRDEVYRYGLTVYDLKGRPSFTKWIADIRFPKINEELDPGTTWSSLYTLTPVDGVSPTGIMNIRALGIKFTIDWDAINTDHPGLVSLISGIQFVRMPRTSSDCTIKASGIIVPTQIVLTPAGYIKDTSYSTYQISSGKDYSDGLLSSLAGITGANSALNNSLIELISPEIATNKDLTIDSTNDFLQPIGYIDNIQSRISNVDRDAFTVTAMTISPYNTTNTKIANSWRKTVEDGVVSLPQAKSPTTLVINSSSYTPRGYDGEFHADLPEMTYKGTTLLVGVNSAFTDVTSGGSAGEHKAIYGYYRRYLGNSIYNGVTYSERSYSQYIKASEFIVKSTSGSVDYNVYNGDTYINPFAFLKLAYDSNSEYGTVHSGQVYITFPVESRINLAYRLDKINKYFYPDDTYDYYLQEYQSTGFSQYPNTYPNTGDLYRYNSAYSAEDISKLYPTKPFDFRGRNQQDVLVVSSEKKFSGEYRDSWLTFKYNNYLELDGVLGSITRLLNKNDKLLAFQQRGISGLSVLERELVNTNNAQLATGSGGVLSRSDYISRNIGTTNYYGIIDTETGIYFYNDNDSSIYRIGNGLEPISDTKGMKSYFDSYKFTSLIGTYDKRNREVLFSPGTTHAQNTLCFSGFTDLFTGFYSLKDNSVYVEKYINFDKYMLSSVDSNVFYLHDTGNYNQFYGVTHPSTVTVLPNPAKSTAVSFQVIEWLMDVTNNGVEVAGETFDSVHITNTYQDTGVLTFPGFTGLIRRFRAWRMNVFRDSLIANSYGRIRDSWLKAKFSYTPTNTNDKGVVHPINFYVQQTKIN